MPPAEPEDGAPGRSGGTRLGNVAVLARLKVLDRTPKFSTAKAECALLDGDAPAKQPSHGSE